MFIFLNYNNVKYFFVYTIIYFLSFFLTLSCNSYLQTIIYTQMEINDLLDKKIQQTIFFIDKIVAYRILFLIIRRNNWVKCTQIVDNIKTCL